MNRVALFLSLLLSAGLFAAPPAAQAQKRCPEGSQTINCEFHPKYGWIVIGSAPRSSSGDATTPVPPAVDPKELARSRERYRQDQQRISEENQKLISDDRLRRTRTARALPSPHGKCQELTKKESQQWASKTLAEIQTATWSAEAACIARKPLLDGAAYETACYRASRLMRLPKKINPNADLEKAYYYKLRDCYEGKDEYACFGLHSSWESKATGCIGESFEVPPTTNAGTRGTCNLDYYAMKSLGPDAQRDLLSFHAKRCLQNGDGASCFTTAVANATFRIPEANPNHAFFYMRKSCLNNVDEACDEMVLSCDPG
jgi:hypothetical protein